MKISRNRFLQSLRWLALLLLAVVVASCSGAGNCASSNGTVVDLHTFPNGSQLFGTTSLNITSGESTTATYVLKGGSGLTIVNLSTQESGLNTAALSHGLTRNCALCGSFNPESLVVTGTSAESSSQLTVNVRSGLAAGTYSLNLYATYTNDGVTQDKEQIGVISVTVTAATSQPGVLAIYSVAESTINVGESTTAVISMNNSSGITTPVDVTIASIDAAVMTVSPASCALTTASNSCTVTLTGVATGTTTFSAVATGYTTATSDAVMVVTSQVRIYLPQTGQMNQVPSMCSPISATCINSPVGSDGYGYISGPYYIPYGVAWAYNGYSDLVPPTRFTVDPDSSNCIIDNLTGLEWVRDLNLVAINSAVAGSSTTWQNALNSITTANAGAGYCGHTDWYLPTVNELSSLLNAGQTSPAGWLNTEGFINVSVGSSYWSSSTLSADNSGKWVVFFSSGNIDKTTSTNTRNVWPVRQHASIITAPAQVAATGESGGAAGSSNGIAWTNQRFVAGNGVSAACITDELTGLTWPKNGIIGFESTDGGVPIAQPDYVNITASLNEVKWANALTAVNNMNTAPIKLCGYSDWRLPNAVELKSMINYGVATTPATWLIAQNFSDVQSGLYWSSSIVADNVVRAWYVSFFLGTVLNDHQFFPHFVWPVRGGQGGSN